MSILQTYPRGYLGYLRQKIGGRAPQSLSEELRPIIDAGEFYGENNFLYVTQTLGPNPGSFVAATVPPDKRWWVKWVGLRLVAQDVGAMMITMRVQNASSSTSMPIMDTWRPVVGSSAAGYAYDRAIPIPKPFILDPGFKFVVEADPPSTTSGTPWDIYWSALVFPMAI